MISYNEVRILYSNWVTSSPPVSIPNNTPLPFTAMKQHLDLIQTLAYCAASCQHCSDQCLNEEDIAMMTACIRLDRDCAEACLVALNFIARQSDSADQAVSFCAALCRQCAEECATHEAQHCKDCAEACRSCAQACEQYLG